MKTKYYIIQVDGDYLSNVCRDGRYRPGCGLWAKFPRKYSSLKTEAMRFRANDADEVISALVSDGVHEKHIEKIAVNYVKFPAKVFAGFDK